MSKKARRKIKNPQNLPPWGEKYAVMQMGSVGYCWAVFTARWRSINPMRRISPWFYYKHEAVNWIDTKWKAHVDKKLETFILGGER